MHVVFVPQVLRRVAAGIKAVFAVEVQKDRTKPDKGRRVSTASDWTSICLAYIDTI